MRLNEKTFKRFEKRLTKEFFKQYKKNKWYIECNEYTACFNGFGINKIQIRFGLEIVDIEPSNNYDVEIEFEYYGEYNININVGMALKQIFDTNNKEEN